MSKVNPDTVIAGIRLGDLAIPPMTMSQAQSMGFPSNRSRSLAQTTARILENKRKLESVSTRTDGGNALLHNRLQRDIIRITNFNFHTNNDDWYKQSPTFDSDVITITFANEPLQEKYRRDLTIRPPAYITKDKHDVPVNAYVPAEKGIQGLPLIQIRKFIDVFDAEQRQKVEEAPMISWMKFEQQVEALVNMEQYDENKRKEEIKLQEEAMKCSQSHRVQLKPSAQAAKQKAIKERKRIAAEARYRSPSPGHSDLFPPPVKRMNISNTGPYDFPVPPNPVTTPSSTDVSGPKMLND